MKTTADRLNNIIGQLNGAGRMLEDKDRDCFSLLIQLKAARSAISSLMEKVVAEEFDHCLLNSKNYSKDKIERIFKEVIRK